MYNDSIKDQYNKVLWDLSEFTEPNGIFVNNDETQQTFVPKLLPPIISFDNEMVMLLAQAERKVGELKGKGSELDNPHILINTYLKREAELSSKIEGTLASLDDINKHESLKNFHQNVIKDLRLAEVMNYVRALEESLKNIKKINQLVDLDTIKQAHKILMTNVRGKDKNPGEFRTQQNWIIRIKSTKKTIIYTPPLPEKIPNLLKNFEEFLQTDHKQIPALIQCAIIHYQFDAIHPFLDGNGRIGRLLLPLLLHKKGLMPEPLLYLSAYFDKYREEYYKGLLAVSQKSKWSEWIKFFLNAFIQQSDYTLKNIEKLTELKIKYKEILKQKNTSSKIIILMEHLFSNPYITIPRAADYLKTSYPSAKNVVTKLVDVEILKPTNIINNSKVFLANEINEIISID